jgi:hypothetical protein
MTILMRFLRRRKTAPTVSTQSSETTVATQAPEADANAELDPPPYSASSPSQPDQSVTPDTSTQVAVPVAVPQETVQHAQPTLLDPNLNFTAAHMEQQWRAKDKAFARAVVQFIAERFDGNLKSWAGHKYTYINEVQSFLASSSRTNCTIRMRILLGKRVHGMISLDIMPGHIEEDSDK